MGKHFTERERYKIENWLEEKVSKAEIARKLNKSYSAVCREIKRGTVKQTVKEYIDVYVYKADYAEIKHLEACENKGRSRIFENSSETKNIIIRLLKKGYSPEAAAHLLKRDYHVKISYKTIYNAILHKDLGGLKMSDLPYHKKKKTVYQRKPKKVVVNRRSIEERPEHINTREAFGHWEMDCILSGQCTTSTAALLVITERLTRYSYVYKMPNKTQESVKACLDDLEQTFDHAFPLVFKSITMDNGSEFINQSYIENSSLNEDFKRTVAYYCHAYSAYERGSNENYNRFIRRFIPKGANIAKISKAFIKEMTDFINDYPRKMFKFQSSSYYLKNALSDLNLI